MSSCIDRRLDGAEKDGIFLSLLEILRVTQITIHNLQGGTTVSGSAIRRPYIYFYDMLLASFDNILVACYKADRLFGYLL